MTSYPENLRYTKDHEWIDAEGNERRVGITQFAANQLGDIVMVDITRKVGDAVQKGESFGVVESVKSVSELYAPVSGKIVAINDELRDSPEQVNTDPYSGWMVKIAPSDSADFGELIDAAAYTQHTAES